MAKKKLALKRRPLGSASVHYRLTQLFCPLAVQRSVATTSVASKKPAAEALLDETAQNGTSDNERASSSNHTLLQAKLHSTSRTADTQRNPSPQPAAGHGKPVENDWEDEKVIEEAALQAMVERLHDKGEKEVARVLKVRSPFEIGSEKGNANLHCSQSIEYDKRLAASFPRLEINQDIRDRVLELALEDERGANPGEFLL